ncbi:serine/threonine-protein kinase [Nocardia cyriacigeorgica]|uniref:non-specific serine/threonine protein kinase n=1 Tax=Nocardia cyriacigeorgica TaxID=135487 RepID=A0A6P1D8K8_9NOCA|nr:serine/threonine-protein kinase [Nocardia cyriacigeorgica]NEW45584.1 protein kinase [Nocardia cyriacigeorgica]
MLAAGDEFVGYTIRKVLGRGGMGTVYLAKHPRLPRLTALKLLNRELYTDNEIRRRFEREADLAAQLDHPNIVTVYDRGAEDRQLWISMQFVPGADASIADVNVLAPGRAVQIIAETAAALDFAHANRVLHRDVKPANILLAKAPIGQPERVLLTDFGIAGMRDSDTTLSSADTITATLAFAAPEQLTGAKLDHRGDQYSLACTLYWLLTGDSPYSAASPAAVINGHLSAPVPRLSRVRPGLPPGLDDVLARALAKGPVDRYSSCTEFAAAARRALGTSGAQQHYTGWLPTPGPYVPPRHGSAGPAPHHGNAGPPHRHPTPPPHPVAPSRGVPLYRYPQRPAPGPHGAPPPGVPPHHGPAYTPAAGHPAPHGRGPESRPDHRFPPGWVPPHPGGQMPPGHGAGEPPVHGGSGRPGSATPPGTRPFPRSPQHGGTPPGHHSGDQWPTPDGRAGSSGRGAGDPGPGAGNGAHTPNDADPVEQAAEDNRSRPATPRRPPAAVIDLPGAPRRPGRAPFGGQLGRPRQPPPEQ